MDDFFEKLERGRSRGRRRAHGRARPRCASTCGDSVQTLRGVERVGGWFLRSDRGSEDDPGRRPRHGQHLRGGHPGRPARARRRSTSTPRSGSRPARSPRSTSPRASGRLGADQGAAEAGSADPGAPDAPSTTSAGGATGMTISSPTLILFGFLIFLLAASSSIHRQLVLLGDLEQRVAGLDDIDLSGRSGRLGRRR